jgi:hypothetical protein
MGRKQRRKRALHITGARRSEKIPEMNKPDARFLTYVADRLPIQPEPGARCGLGLG